MALAESFLRKVHKLGLVPKIVRALPVFSFLLAIASVAWLLVLPMDGQYRNTYISENALMPGQVTSYFRESEWNIVRGYRHEVLKWDFQQMQTANPVLESWLQDIGLKVTHHVDAETNTDTMYAVMHAPRGDNTEAMVLVVPYFTSDSAPNLGGFALAPALARYFLRMSIWQKNIIFVFPQNTHTVLRKWVEAYHTELDVTAGSIEAAIVMEYASDLDNFHHMELSYEGLNGQLPNLDLINTATTIARNEMMKVSIQNSPYDELERNDYYSRLKTLFRGIAKLASSGLRRNSPGCESFSGWQIQAITIKAVGVGGPDITQFGRIADLSFRAVNNLLEKFHQSFFFYLMLSPLHFVSIGTYLPSAALLAFSFAISSLYTLANGVSATEYLLNGATLLAIFTGIELVCLAGTFALLNLVVVAQDPDSITASVISTIVAVTIALSLTVPFAGNIKWRMSKTVSYLVLAFSLYFIAMLIISLLIVHFALAFTIGIFALPLTFIPQLITSKNANAALEVKNNLKIALCLLASSPFVGIPLFAYIYDGGKFKQVVALTRGLLTSWEEMQCWTWFVIALGWLPAWISITFACLFGDFKGPAKTKND